MDTPLLSHDQRLIHPVESFTCAFYHSVMVESQAPAPCKPHLDPGDDDSEANAVSSILLESKALGVLARPLAIAIWLEVLPSTLLTMLSGHTDTEQSTQILAAFNLESVFEIALIAGVMDGFAAGLDALCSCQKRGMAEFWLLCQAGLALYLLCVPIVGAFLGFSGPILKVLGQDPDIADIAGKILIVTAVSFPLAVVVSVLKCALKAQNPTGFHFERQSFAAWVASTTIAYLLAFNSPLGYMGLALAPPLCWLLKLLMLLHMTLRNTSFVHAWPGWKCSRAMALVPSVARTGGPIALFVTMHMLGFAVMALLAGLLPGPDVAMAASSILGSLLIVCFPPLIALSVAGAIRIDSALRDQRVHRAKVLGYAVLLTCLAMSICMSLLVPVVAESFARAFTSNQDAIDMVADLVDYHLPVLVLYGFLVALQGILRACRRHLLCAGIHIVGVFLIGLPVGSALAIKWEHDLVGIWIGNAVGLAIAVLLDIAWLVRADWSLLAREAHSRYQRV